MVKNGGTDGRNKRGKGKREAEIEKERHEKYFMIGT